MGSRGIQESPNWSHSMARRASAIRAALALAVVLVTVLGACGLRNAYTGMPEAMPDAKKDVAERSHHEDSGDPCESDACPSWLGHRLLASTCRLCATATGVGSGIARSGPGPPALVALALFALALLQWLRNPTPTLRRPRAGCKTRTDRPVIGILSQPANFTSIESEDVPSFDGKTYIAASYVRWIEQTGARVLPIMADDSTEELDRKFK